MPFGKFSRVYEPAQADPILEPKRVEIVNEFGNIEMTTELVDTCDISKSPHFSEFSLQRMLDSSQPLNRVSIDPLVGDVDSNPITSSIVEPLND